MAKLSELIVSQKLKLLLIGASGSGKTVMAASAPGKTLILDFDNKASSAASYYAHYNPKQLENIEVEAFSLNKMTDSPYEKFIAWLDRLEERAKEEKFPFDTVVIDSLTLYAEALMGYVMKHNPGIKRAFSSVPAMQDYLVAGTKFREDINRILSLPCHVICTAHSATQKDDVTGELRNTILLAGKTAEHLPRIFTEVYWAHVKKNGDKIEHVAQTRSDGRFTCRTQIPTIPNFVPLQFETIYGYINKPKENNK